MRDADAIHWRSLLHYLPSLHWSALRAGYQVLHSLVFSSLEPLGNWQLTLLPLLIANSYDWYLLKGRNPKPFQVLKSWPVFTPQFPYNLLDILVSWSQPISSPQPSRSPGFISACSAYPRALPEPDHLFHHARVVGLVSFWHDQESGDPERSAWHLRMLSYLPPCTSKASSFSCSLSFFGGGGR